VADAENAAWKLALVARGWAGDDLLESYHEERHAAALENLEVTAATMRFLVPQDESDRRHRLAILEAAATDADARRQVDAGRFAEPFWYVDSRLTTPSAERPFSGRPPLGQVPPPGPGILLPDAPVTATDAAWLRQLARDGFLLLFGRDVDPAEAAAAATAAGPLPVQVMRVDDIDAGGEVRGTLDLRPDEVWVVRPDAYVAAVVPGERTAVAAALLRAAALEGASRVAASAS
jgi:pentachlorophenol monooxygenase/3-(3-hydroxy-phenyl)propionate hydroxylase